jgi:hypothetical protein
MKAEARTCSATDTPLQGDDAAFFFCETHALSTQRRSVSSKLGTVFSSKLGIPASLACAAVTGRPATASFVSLLAFLY